MKLVHPEIEKIIELEENTLNIIIIENQAFLRKLTLELQRQICGEEGDFVLSNKDILKINKEVEIITDLYNININSKEIISKIYKYLEDRILENYPMEERNELLTYIIKYLENIVDISGLDLEYDLNIRDQNIFKMVNLKLYEENTSYIENFINYIKIITDLMGKKIFVINNLKGVITEKEYFYLKDFAFKNKIHLILFENIERKVENWERVILIDNDLCEVI